MIRFCILLLSLILCGTFVNAQSVESAVNPVITSENGETLAIITRTTEEDWGEDWLRNYATIFAFFPDSRRMVIAGDRSVVIVDALTGEILGSIETQNPPWYQASMMTFSSDGSLLATRGGRGITVWDTVARQSLFSVSVNNDIITLLTPFTWMGFSSDNSSFYVTDANDVLRVWDVGQSREIDRRQFCNAFMFKDDTALCRLGTGAFGYQYIDLTSFELVATLSIPGVNGIESDTIALSPDGSILSFYAFSEGESQRYYFLLDLETRKVRERVAINYQRPVNYIINHTGRLIAASSNDNQLTIMDAVTGETVMSFPSQVWWHFTYMQFSPDGTLFAIGNFSEDAIDIYAASECFVTSDGEVNLRTGPGTEFDNPSVMKALDRLAVDGQSQQGNYIWWHLSIGLWVREDIVDQHGDNCTNVNHVE